MRIFSIEAEGHAVAPVQRDCLHALAELGHELCVLPTGSRMNPIAVRAILRRFHPDFAFFLSNLNVPVEILDDLGLPFASWFIDNPFRFLGEGFRTDRFSLFTWDRSYVVDLKRYGIHHVHWLPLAASPARYGTAEFAAVPNATLSFVGDCGDEVLLHDLPFAQVPGLREAVADLVEAQSHQTTRPALDLARELARRSPIQALLWRALEVDPALEREVDVTVQASSGALYRRRMLRAIAEAGLPLDVYGPPGWPIHLAGLPSARFHGWIENGEPLAVLYRASHVNLNVTISQLRTALPMRIFDALAAGGCVLSDWREDIETLFTPGEDLFVARETGEMIELARWILRSPQEARRVAETGRSRIVREHTFRHRMWDMVERMCADHDLVRPGVLKVRPAQVPIRSYRGKQ